MRFIEKQSMTLIFLLSLLLFSSSSYGALYLQAEGNKIDVESGLSGASIDGTGFGGRVGYLWGKSLGFEAGYTMAKAELDGQIFSASDKYDADFALITAGLRWWMMRWLDLSLGFVSVNGKVDMSLTVPGLGTMNGDGKYSSTGYYFGLGVNVPIRSVDIFLAYNMYRWSESEFDGTLTGAKSDKGINTIAGGLRLRF